MHRYTRRGVLAGVTALLVSNVGCDLGSIMYFLGPEPKIEAELRQLAKPKEEEPARVVILASTSKLVTDRELFQVDRELAANLARHLIEQAAYNEESITVIHPNKVEEFKNTHPDWKDMDPAEIGRNFKADYVISLEINSIRLFVPRSNGQLLQGQIHVHVALVDVNRPDAPPQRRDFHADYPKTSPLMNEDASSAMQFRPLFLDIAGKKLAWFFSAHPRKDLQRLD